MNARRRTLVVLAVFVLGAACAETAARALEALRARNTWMLFEIREEDGRRVASTRFTHLADPERGEVLSLPDGRPFKVLSPIPEAHVDLEKPRDVRRVFLVGSSPIAGIFGSLRLGDVLRPALAGGTELVDLGARGFGTTEISIAVTEALRLAPDVVVVYPGGIAPEFEPGESPRDFARPPWQRRGLRLLRELRILRPLFAGGGVAWADAVQADLRPPVKSVLPEPKEIADRVDAAAVRLQENLRTDLLAKHRRTYLDLARRVRDAGATLVFMTPVTKLSGFWPLLSHHRADLSAAALKDWLAAYTDATTKADADRCEEALASFEAALAIDDGFAALWYRIGVCRLALGERAEALGAFREALAHDASPDRIISRPLRLEDELRSLPGVVIFDTEAALATAFPESAFGADLFLDYSHFTDEALRAIAEALAAAVENISRR